MQLPIYNILDGDLTFISLVEFPAVESDFLRFAKEKQPMPLKFDDGKHLITGIAMKADTPIYRFSPSMGEYYVTFSPEVIETLALKFFKQHRNSDVNIEHTETVEGITILESYFVNKDRGIVPNEFSDVPNGSWIVSYKVENDELYNKIKNGEVKGFSVEGIFTLSDEPINKDEVEEQKDEMAAFLESLLG